MSRFVHARRPSFTDPAAAASVDPQTSDDYAARVAKYIPGEVLAGYVSALGILGTQTPQPLLAHRIVFFVFLAGTPIYLLRVARPNDRPTLTQLVVSTAAFVVWSYSLEGFTRAFALPYEAWIGALSLLLFTVVSGWIIPADGR